MAFKFILFCALAAVASAQYHHDSQGHQQHHIQVAPVLLKSVGPTYQHANAGHHEEEHYGPAQYEFSYSVHDEKHGDIKHQKETRHGDQVQGEYSLIEPDGHRRTVKYSSDKHTGFVAEVHREEVKGYQAPVQASYQHEGYSHGQENVAYVQKVVAAPVYQKTVVAAPVYQKVAVAAPVYVSHGDVNYAQSSGSSQGSSGHLGLGHYSTGSGLTKSQY